MGDVTIEISFAFCFVRDLMFLEFHSKAKFVICVNGAKNKTGYQIIFLILAMLPLKPLLVVS